MYVIDRNTQQTPEGLSHYYIYTESIRRDEVKQPAQQKKDQLP